VSKNRRDKQLRRKARKEKAARKATRGPKCSCCHEPTAIGWQRDNQNALGRVCRLCAAPGQPIKAARPRRVGGFLGAVAALLGVGSASDHE